MVYIYEKRFKNKIYICIAQRRVNPFPEYPKKRYLLQLIQILILVHRCSEKNDLKTNSQLYKWSQFKNKSFY